MSVMDLAVIMETEGWRMGDITNQLYVGPVWSGGSSFTAPAILMEATLFTLPRFTSDARRRIVHHGYHNPRF